MKAMISSNLKADKSLWHKDEWGVEWFNLCANHCPERDEEGEPLWLVGNENANNWIFRPTAYKEVFSKGMREIDSYEVFDCDWKPQLRDLVFETVNDCLPEYFTVTKSGWLKYTGNNPYISWEEAKDIFDSAVMEAWTNRGLIRKGYRLIRAIYRIQSHNHSVWANTFND